MASIYHEDGFALRGFSIAEVTGLGLTLRVTLIPHVTFADTLYETQEDSFEETSLRYAGSKQTIPKSRYYLAPKG